VHQQSPETETGIEVLARASRLRCMNGLTLPRMFILGVVTESSSTVSWMMHINWSRSMLYAMIINKIKNSNELFMVVLLMLGIITPLR